MITEAGNRIAQLLLFPYLKGKAASVNKDRKFQKYCKKGVFWQIVINDERHKLNGIKIEGLLDSGGEISIISQEFWDPNWPLYSNLVEIRFHCLQNK